MDRFKGGVLWVALAVIILLIFLSIYGAFLGAERAQDFFNSLPLAVYWLVFVSMLGAGLVVFRQLVRAPALLLIHAGCVLILGGAMWGSKAGHGLQQKLLGIDKIPAGQMVIFEGQSERHVKAETGEGFRELPFSIRLKDFRMEYYEPEYLYIEAKDGQRWKMPVEIEKEFALGTDFGTAKIVRRFENFKINIEGDRRQAYDDPEGGYNPALEVQIRDANGDVRTKYVFERFGGHVHPEDRFALSYRRVVRDYVSELAVIKDDRIVLEKNIEVNHPLHFGGYHFYQHWYDDEGHQYTILEVVSESGLNAVYGGYAMLCIGVFGHLWLRGFLARRRQLRS
jgi:hypothetical protein